MDDSTREDATSGFDFIEWESDSNCSNDEFETTTEKGVADRIQALVTNIEKHQRSRAAQPPSQSVATAAAQQIRGQEEGVADRQKKTGRKYDPAWVAMALEKMDADQNDAESYSGYDADVDDSHETRRFVRVRKIDDDADDASSSSSVNIGGEDDAEINYSSQVPSSSSDRSDLPGIELDPAIIEFLRDSCGESWDDT